VAAIYRVPQWITAMISMDLLLSLPAWNQPLHVDAAVVSHLTNILKMI